MRKRSSHGRVGRRFTEMFSSWRRVRERIAGGMEVSLL